MESPRVANEVAPALAGTTVSPGVPRKVEKGPHYVPAAPAVVERQRTSALLKTTSAHSSPLAEADRAISKEPVPAELLSVRALHPTPATGKIPGKYRDAVEKPDDLLQQAYGNASPCLLSTGTSHDAEREEERHEAGHKNTTRLPRCLDVSSSVKPMCEHVTEAGQLEDREKVSGHVAFREKQRRAAKDECDVNALSSPDTLRLLTSSCTTPTALPSCNLAVVPVNEKYAKTTEGATDIHGDLFSRVSLSEKSNELQSPHLHTRCKDATQGQGPEKPLEPLLQQQEASPPGSIQAELPQVNKRDMDLIREISASCAEHFFKGVSDFRLCFNSTDKGQLRSPAVVAPDLPSIGRQSFPSLGDTAFLTGSKEAKAIKSSVLCHDIHNSKRAQEPKEGQPDLYIAATGHDYVEEALKVDNGDSVAAGWADSCKAPHAFKYQNNSTELFSGFFGLQMPYQNTGEKSQSCLIESAQSDPSHGAGCSRRESPSVLYQEIESREESPPPGAFGTTLKCTPEERVQTAQTKQVTPLVRTDCNAADDCAQADLEDYSTWAQGAHTNCFPKLLLSLGNDNNPIIKSGDGEMQHSLCAGLQTEKEGSSVSSFSTELSPLLTRSGPALDTPVCSVKHDTSMQNDESDIFLRNGNTLHQGATYALENPFNGTETATNGPAATRHGMPSSFAPAPSKSIVLEHAAQRLAENIASRPTLSCTCTEDQLQGRKDHREQQLQHMQRKEQHKVSHESSGQISSSGQDELRAYSQEHPHGRDKASLSPVLPESTSGNMQQRSTTLLAAPGWLTEKGTADVLLESGPRMPQAYTGALPLMPPEEHSHPSCAPLNSLAQEAAVSTVNAHPVAPSDVSPLCHPSCKQTMVSTPEHSARLHGTSDMVTVPNIAGGTCIERNSETSENTAIPDTRFRTGLESIVPDIEKNCLSSGIRMVPEDVRRHVELKETAAQNSRVGVPDTPGLFSSFGTRDTAGASSSAGSARNSVLCCETTLSPGRTSGHGNAQRVQSLFKALVPATVAEEVSSDFASQPSARRTRPLLNSERPLCSATTSANDAHAGGFRGTVDSDYASNGNCNAIAINRNNSTWCSEDHFGQSSKGKDVENSSGVQADVGALANSVGDYFDSRAKLSDTELLQIYEAYTAVDYGVSLVDPERHSVVYSSNSNATGSLESARSSFPPRSEVQLQKVAAVTYPESSYSGTTGEHPVSTQPTPSVGRAPIIDESPPSEAYAGMHDHSSSAAVRTKLAAISMLELLAFLPAVQGESSGGRPDGHATRTHPGEVKPAPTWPGAGSHISTADSMMACSSNMCTSIRKVSSFWEDRIAQVPVQNGVSAFPVKGRTLDGQHEVIRTCALKPSMTMPHRANCCVAQESESSTALGTLNNTSDIVMPTNFRDPIPSLQPCQPDTKENGLAVWPPACPVSRHLALCLKAVLSAGNSKGGQLKAAETVDAADDDASRSGMSILGVGGESGNLLQQPAQQKLIMSTTHLFNSLATNSGATLSKTEVGSRNTEEAAGEAEQCFPIASVSPAPGPLYANFFRGDARPPHKAPAARWETGACLDYARTQWTCAPKSSNWLDLLSPSDRVAHSGISPCIVGSRQQTQEETSSAHADCSCVSCAGLPTKGSRNIPVETTQRLTRTDDVCTLENHQQSGKPTSDMSRDAGTRDNGNADAAIYPNGGKTTSFPDQQKSNLSCVDEGIRKLADGVVLRDLVCEAVNKLEDVPPRMQSLPFSTRHQPVNRNTVRLTSETVTVADNGHNAALSIEAIFSPVAGVSKDAEGESKEVFDTVPSPPERSLEQSDENVQRQQRQQRDQPELSRWHQQQEPKLEQHGQMRRQFPDGGVPLPSTASFGRWMLPKTTHLPDRHDVVSFKNHGQPVARPSPGQLLTTRDASPKSAAPSGSKKVLPFTRTCPRGFFPYSNQRRSGSPTRQKREALLSRERRHLGGDARTRRSFESPRTDKTSATSSLRSTLFNDPKSAVKHVVQAQHYHKPSRLLQQNTPALFFPAAVREPSVELSLPYTQPSGFPCNASNIAPPPPPPPPPPTPPPNTTAYCNSKINSENRLLPSAESGASSPTVLPSLDELVEKTREISWLHVLQGILEQQARRGGGTVSEAIAAALAVADASVHGPIMTADAQISKQDGSAAPLEVMQPVHLSPTLRDANGGSPTAGEFAATTAVPANEDMQTPLQNCVELLPTRLVERVANSVSGSVTLAGYECWAASSATPAPPLSSGCTPVQPGALSQTALTSADACWSLTESSLFHWRKLRGLEGEACVDTSTTKAVTHMLPKRQVSTEGEKRTEGAEETTSMPATLTKLALKHDPAAQDPSELNRRQGDDAAGWSARGETTDCAVESAAEQQGVQENISRERVKVEEAQTWGENGEQQRLGISEGQQARRRPPRPSKRQRVLIRALSYVKQRLKTLECEVLPLVAPDTLGQTTALPKSDSKHRNHRDA